MKSCELKNENSHYLQLKQYVKCVFKCLTSKECPVKWLGSCSPSLLKLKRKNEPVHNRDPGHSQGLRLNPKKTSNEKANVEDFAACKNNKVSINQYKRKDTKVRQVLLI